MFDELQLDAHATLGTGKEFVTAEVAAESGAGTQQSTERRW